MNKIKYSTILLATTLAITLVFSCKKTPDMPPVTPLGSTLTIAQLRALFVGNNIKFTQDISLFALVTMTDNYKTLYLRDNTGCISLKQLSAHGIYAGDSLRINLNGSTLDLSGLACSMQIDSVDVSSSPTNKVVKLANGKPVNPVVVSIAQLNNSVTNYTYSTISGVVVVPQSKYDAELIQIDGAQFAFTNTGLYFPLVPTSVYATIPMYDCGNINTIALSLYTGTADFVNKQIPNTKSGVIIGAASFYNDALQITPRSYNDVMFDQPRCGADTLTQTFYNATSAVSSLSTFNTTFPGWANINYAGNLLWTGTPSSPPGYMSATNHFGSNGTSGNVIWLISPPIQNSPTKKLQFQTAVDYPVTTHPRQLSVWISTNYDGTNIGGPNHSTSNQATWTEITAAFPNIQNGSLPSAFFTDAYTGNQTPGPVMLSSATSVLAGYTGTFYIGFRYVGNLATDSTQTVDIKNVIIKN